VSVTPDDCQSVSTPLTPGGGVGFASTVAVVEPGGTTSASCVTVKLWPESVIVSVLAEPVLVSTEYVTVPDAEPLPDVTWIQPAVVAAVQVHPEVVVTANVWPEAPDQAIAPLLVGFSA
jgi:hypothetical protein